MSKRNENKELSMIGGITMVIVGLVSVSAGIQIYYEEAGANSEFIPACIIGGGILLLGIALMIGSYLLVPDKETDSDED